MITTDSKNRVSKVLSEDKVAFTGNKAGLKSPCSVESYFLSAYFIESKATAKIIMPPLIMNCQYGLMPM